MNIREATKRALSLEQQGSLTDAERLYNEILRVRPDDFAVLHLLGVLYARQGNLKDGIELLARAVKLVPTAFEAHFSLGNAWFASHQYDEALASFEKALAIKADYVDALFGVGSVLARLHRFRDAIAAYDRALRIEPRHASVHYNRGNALAKLGRYEAALTDYEETLRNAPAHIGALRNRANALQMLKRDEEAIEPFKKLISAEPGYENALGSFIHSLARLCAWDDYAEMKNRVLKAVRDGQPASPPFPFLSISNDPEEQLLCATTFVRRESPAILPGLSEGVRYAHDRIRVAYLSADFREHPVAFLMAGLFEQHERSRFETTAISFGPVVKSRMRTRLKAAFDRFIDAEEKSDAEVARLLRELEIDIAVDLMGFTFGARTSIFARRPAPIQVNYLGYPGTMGADYIDYIIADRFVIPEEAQRFYTEKVVYLPECYQVNDAKRRIAKRTPTRAEAGLPEQGFVFCCFNNSYKLNPEMFDIWMRLLRQAGGSVLWLAQGSEKICSNLRLEAQARGVASERLIFAPRLSLLEDHMARYRLADLFLDTLPYNASTTASDALWAGLPVLTCAGKTLIGRTAGSLLHAVGLPELVTYSLQDYEALALQLATDPERLRPIRQKLATNRLSTPLFNTDRFRRHLEAAYATMWQLHQSGLRPRQISVAPRKGLSIKR